MSAPQVVYAAPSGGGSILGWIGTLIGLVFLGVLLFAMYAAYKAFQTATDPVNAITGMLDLLGLGELGKGLGNAVGDAGKFLTGGGNKECQAKYGSNAFWDAVGGGTCYTCPSGHKMQVLETLNSGKKCALTTCPSGYKNDALAGKCYKCDPGYIRTWPDAVWSSTACCKGFLCSGGKRRAHLKNKWTRATRKGKLNEGYTTTADNYHIADDQWTKFRYLQEEPPKLIIQQRKQ